MKRTIEDIDVKGKRVFLRVDFNVPVDDDGNVMDSNRITRELPTINYLIQRGAKVIICSHLGRPKGKPNPKLSMVSVAKHLINFLHCKVRFSPSAIGDVAKEKVAELADGEVLVLENIRFYEEEEQNSPLFAAKLAELADIYVNDAFGCAHRKHASTYGIAKLLPNAVGFLMGKEINTITKALENPVRPFVAILGGAKVSDKLPVIHNLINKCDSVLIGGGMAYTFLKAKGCEIGKSLYEEECLEDAKSIIEEAEAKGVELLLPVDHFCSTVFSPTADSIKVDSASMPTNLMGLDIGKKTLKLYTKKIKKAATIIWNGPMGVFEFSGFKGGTKGVAVAVAKNKGKTIVGGGDSISAINEFKLANKIYHISTGGGASLKLIGGEELPGVEVIAEV
ncbi:MAG: phosphoglycerate kinase [Clostridia bacterium]|nr:phosphoglycerate kinase [Clostridia bacterium]